MSRRRREKAGATPPFFFAPARPPGLVIRRIARIYLPVYRIALQQRRSHYDPLFHITGS
jgi:hypothetical protein